MCQLRLHIAMASYPPTQNSASHIAPHHVLFYVEVGAMPPRVGSSKGEVEGWIWCLHHLRWLMISRDRTHDLYSDVVHEERRC